MIASNSITQKGHYPSFHLESVLYNTKLYEIGFTAILPKTQYHALFGIIICKFVAILLQNPFLKARLP
jgi:hypothetical protein